MKNKLLTEEIKAQLTETLRSKEVGDAIASMKAATDNGTFRMIVSTDDTDRAGEIVAQDGWDLSYYKMNPIVLWAHDYGQLPVGVTENIYVEGNKLIAEGRFATTAFAQEVRKLYEDGIMKTASVGFIPLEWGAGEGDRNKITKAQLLEWSFVPVPCNPMALSLAKTLNLNVEEMVVKGIMVKEEEVTPEETVEVEEIVESGEATTEEEKKPEEVIEEPAQTEEIAPETEPTVDEVAEKAIEKAGKVLSSANRTKIESAIEALQAVLALADNASGDEEKAVVPVPVKTERSKAVIADLKGLDEHLNAQQVLRAINNATSKALQKYNSKKNYKA